MSLYFEIGYFRVHIFENVAFVASRLAHEIVEKVARVPGNWFAMILVDFFQSGIEEIQESRSILVKLAIVN